MKRMGFASKILVFSSLALVIFLADWMGVGRGIKNVFEVPVVFIKRGVIGLWSTKKIFRDMKEGSMRIEVLNAKLLEANSLATRAAELTAENATLRLQLEVGKPQEERLVMAQPTGYLNGELTLSVGSGLGVNIGDAVVVGRVVVGRVVLVSPHQSRVRSPQFEGEKVEVAVRSSLDGVRRALGVVAASGGQLILDKVVSGETLSKGDLVMTVGGEYSRDLLLGTVGEVLERENQLFKKGIVDPAVDYEQLERVFVVLSSEKI